MVSYQHPLFWRRYFEKLPHENRRLVVRSQRDVHPDDSDWGHETTESAQYDYHGVAICQLHPNVHCSDDHLTNKEEHLSTVDI